MLSISAAALSFAPVAPVTHGVRAVTDVRMQTKADLEVLAKECNPIVGYWCALRTHFWRASVDELLPLTCRPAVIDIGTP